MITLTEIVIKAKNTQRAREKANKLKLPYSEPEKFGSYMYLVQVEGEVENPRLADAYIWKKIQR